MEEYWYSYLQRVLMTDKCFGLVDNRRWKEGVLSTVIPTICGTSFVVSVYTVEFWLEVPLRKHIGYW
jgi:hypothetical protein